MTITVNDPEAAQQCVSGATVTVTDGSYRETYSNACFHFAAYGRPGSYTVSASAEGYTSGAISGVVVSKDCSTWPTPVEIYLTKQH